jgi:DmsE family decaheme c-type cytochrome
MAAIRFWRIRLAVRATLLTVVLLLVVSSMESQNATAQTQKATPAKESFAAKCATCHEALVKQYGTTKHGKADQFGSAGYESCASCHGDVVAHAESGDPSKISNPSKASLAESTGKCLACHNNQHNRTFWQGSKHELSNVGCLSCHSVHHAKTSEKLLAKTSERETCLSCHIDQRKAQTQRSTHLFRDELRRSQMQCSDCHNPHGSETDRMLKATSINETCFQCHAEKRGPFLWEHSPVQENCLTCHAAHGSNNVNLLNMRTPQLCQTCHMQGKHQTVSGFANSPWVLNRACLNCHTKIHGSNHPSGLKLQR